MIWAMLIGLFKSLWTRFAYWIVAAGSILVAILVAFSKGKSAGRQKLKDQLQRADEKAAVRTERIRKSVEKASDKDVRKRLDRWYRD